jgi:HlyD family secretion protein
MDTALIEVDAYLDTKFIGVVTEIPVSANVTGITTDQVTNFNVKIRLLPESYQDKISDTNPYPLRPGMSATADIQTEIRKGVYSIPIQAVTTRVPEVEDPSESEEDEEGQDTSTGSSGDVKAKPARMNNGDEKEKEAVVFVAFDGKAVMKLVKTGIQDNNFIEILEGLDPEDEIIISPYSAISKELNKDMAIEIVAEDRLYSEE